MPTLTADLLKRTDIHVDNVFSKMWQQLGFKNLLNQAGFKKHSGSSAHDVMYLLLLWVWLKVDSVAMFSRDSMQSFSAAKKNTLYDRLNRQDLDWRKLQLQTAKKAINIKLMGLKHPMGTCQTVPRSLSENSQPTAEKQKSAIFHPRLR